MRTAVYPGSFDPITYGHIDVLERALALFDSVIITVAKNASKHTLFTAEERAAMIRDSIAVYPRATVDVFEGRIVDYAREKGAAALVRGLRALSDFEYEFQMALMNRKLASDIETVFLMPNEKYTYLNSTIIRELARLHTDVSDFVPDVVQRELRRKFETDGGRM
jgi:pantetheine-phosphate adenylyltransferase